METKSSRIFEVERRLLSGYYGRLGGLSDLAFRRYILMLSSVRKYRPNDPFIVWTSLRDMKRRGGLTKSLEDEYHLATQELYDKCFIRPRPHLSTSNHPDVNEVLILPEYDGAKYSMVELPRSPENMKSLGRGYIQVPIELMSYRKGNIFHKLIQGCTSKEPSMLWAVVIKLYQYNNLVVHGGIDPEIIRKESGRIFINPIIFEELDVSPTFFEACLEDLQNYGLLGWSQIKYCLTDLVGTQQIHYLQDGYSSLSVARLAYQPSKQKLDWDFSHKEMSCYNNFGSYCS